MKKIIKIAMAAFTACMAAVVMAVTVSAETEDVELSVTRAKMCPAWGQSITYTYEEVNLANFTEDTEIHIEYETEDGAMPENGYNPVELIFQNYVADPQIWCQIAPYEYDETSAKFAYSDMVTFYTDKGGAEDLSDVNNVCFGATTIGAKVTKVTITNVEIPEVTTTTTAATTTEAVTETTTEATTTEAETTAATTAAASSEKESGGIPIVLIVVITVVVAVAVVVTIIVLKSKKRFY
ncbi:MAG: hypothetical protein IJ035_10360 [Oscillospiraceae bacterium]|nr:hypothetical protein [Oscillospiraceae bacterium]